MDDPYQEKKYQVMPGLIHKYQGRALWLASNRCVSYCSFCMRRRIAGNLSLAPFATEEKIKNVLSYLSENQQIREIILSGGDPLVIPQKNLTMIIAGLAKLQKDKKLDIIRIHTRVPVDKPQLIKNWHYQLLKKIKNPYIFIHINQASEITQETKKVVDDLRQKSYALILGQSVLLKGVNDSVQTLCDLFSEIVKSGIIPYCLYQNDPVPWAQHFTVPIIDAINLWQQVRPRLSGLAATAKFIIEPVGGIGKIPVPEAGAWDVDYSHFYDFNKKKFMVK